MVYNEMRSKWAMNEAIVNHIMKSLKLSFAECDNKICMINTEDDFFLDHNEYVYVPITRIALDMEDKSNVVCDAVLLFGDSTLEFHDLENLDAYNYSEFTIDSISRVLNNIRKNVK